MENDTTPLPRELASLGFGPENDQGRFWNADATLGLSRYSNGAWALLDVDGIGANNALRTDDAAHILGKLAGERAPADQWQGRWDYYATAANVSANVTECAYCAHEVQADDYGTVPAADDDAEWTRLAPQHTGDCEWISTRAHRRNVAPEA